MASDYYCRINGKDLGPVSAKHLRYLAAFGKLSPDDLVRKEGTDEWVRAGSLEGLFAEARPPQPGPAPAGAPPAPQRPAPRWRGLLPGLPGGLPGAMVYGGIGIVTLGL